MWHPEIRSRQPQFSNCLLGEKAVEIAYLRMHGVLAILRFASERRLSMLETRPIVDGVAVAIPSEARNRSDEDSCNRRASWSTAVIKLRRCPSTPRLRATLGMTVL